MATLTTNLFRGQGERNDRLTVTEGHWPDDMAGSVVVVGPDKRAPAGHWFAAHGLVEKIHLSPGSDGRIAVEHRLVDSPVRRLRERWPRLFGWVAFAELSPAGVTNLANTNVTSLGDRLFLGYDAGRPVEIDPETLDFVTPVGANDEWLQSVPGPFEPLCAVAAHPAAEPDDPAGRAILTFVNYTQVSPPGVPAETWLVRWDLHGAPRRWRVAGMSPFDSIHDVKTSRDHIVFSDLPFVVEPDAMRGKPRAQRGQDHTKLWIVAKSDLAATPAGGTVEATEVRIPMPTGHIFVDHDEVDGLVRVVAQQIPLSDLMVSLTASSVSHRTGHTVDARYEGLVAQAVQPSVIGRYLIDPATGTMVDAETVIDDGLWGGLLITTNLSHPAARAHQGQLWCAAMGYDPELVPEEWWRLYGEATDGVVPPADLPTDPVAGSLSRVDLDAMKVAEVWTYPDGTFPSPPTFVPRRAATDPDDGYVVVVVHRDGPKEIEVFDANHIADGPLARASGPGFNPSLLLHSCWSPPRSGPRPSRYRVSRRRDVVGALRGMPGAIARLVKAGRAMAG